MPISAEYSLVPYDPVRPNVPANPAYGRLAAAVNRGQPERFRERPPDPKPARPPVPPGFPGTYSARRTLDPPRIPATGLRVDIFV